MDTEIVKVPKQFMTDFNLVAGFYRLAPLGELQDARAAVKRDTESAITTYASLANEIRGNAA